MIKVLIVASILLWPLAANAQKDRMSMSEGFTPQVVRKGEVVTTPATTRPPGIEVFHGTKRIIEKPIIEDLKIKERNRK